MVVQAGAARRTLAASPDQASAALGQIESTGRQALVELRRLLGLLRDGEQGDAALSPQPGLAHLESLVAAAREAGLPVELAVEGEPRPLPDPFLVVATQNPIEYEGTYPLPEAQLDRFLVKVDIGYPSEADEVALLQLAHRAVDPSTLDDVVAVASGRDIVAARDEVDGTTVSDEVTSYVAALVRRTRELPSVALGASPRAAVHLLAASKAAARLAGRDFVTPDDVVRMAPPVLRHRLQLRPEAELERFRPDDAVAAAVPVPR
jgi:MoxR-like ATPase